MEEEDNSIIGYFLSALKQVFFWILDQFFQLVSPFFEGVMDAFPNLIMDAGTGVTYLSYINFFIPLDYGLILMIAYLTIQITFSGVGLVIKYFVPTLG